jgi:ADP-ribose pyrophosphatase YjhB (NUDIX family)
VTPPVVRQTIVGAFICDGSRVLLVHERGDDGSEAWGIPEGRIEPGESPAAALGREVLEETGLRILGDMPVAYVCDTVHEGVAHRAVIYTVASWHGALAPQDPSGHVLEARFVPIAEAARLIAATEREPRMKEPLLAHLRGAGRDHWRYEV